jgi:thioredoxin-like negative regulator of GroEL
VLVAGVPQQQTVPQRAERPRLVFFYSPLSGRCRRVEGFIAQVLQRRQNHETFDFVRVSVERRPDLAERFRVEQVPTICVVDGRKVRQTIVAPRGCRELEQELEPWLR